MLPDQQPFSSGLKLHPIKANVKHTLFSLQIYFRRCVVSFLPSQVSLQCPFIYFNKRDTSTKMIWLNFNNNGKLSPTQRLYNIGNYGIIVLLSAINY